MGQKANTLSLRYGYSKNWNAQWYSKYYYNTFLLQDFKIREFITDFFIVNQMPFAEITILRDNNKNVFLFFNVSLKRGKRIFFYKINSLLIEKKIFLQDFLIKKINKQLLYQKRKIITCFFIKDLKRTLFFIILMAINKLTYVNEQIIYKYLYYNESKKRFINKYNNKKKITNKIYKQLYKFKQIFKYKYVKKHMKKKNKIKTFIKQRKKNFIQQPKRKFFMQQPKRKFFIQHTKKKFLPQKQKRKNKYNSHFFYKLRKIFYLQFLFYNKNFIINNNKRINILKIIYNFLFSKNNIRFLSKKHKNNKYNTTIYKRIKRNNTLNKYLCYIKKKKFIIKNILFYIYSFEKILTDNLAQKIICFPIISKRIIMNTQILLLQIKYDIERHIPLFEVLREFRKKMYRQIRKNKEHYNKWKWKWKWNRKKYEKKRKLKIKNAKKKKKKKKKKKYIYNSIIGVRLYISGRTKKRNMMTKTEIFSNGKIPTQTIKARIGYFQHIADTRLGTLGIKLWLFFKKKRLKKKRFKKKILGKKNNKKIKRKNVKK